MTDREAESICKNCDGTGEVRCFLDGEYMGTCPLCEAGRRLMAEHRAAAAIGSIEGECRAGEA